MAPLLEFLAWPGPVSNIKSAVLWRLTLVAMIVRQCPRVKTQESQQDLNCPSHWSMIGTLMFKLKLIIIIIFFFRNGSRAPNDQYSAVSEEVRHDVT